LLLLGFLLNNLFTNDGTGNISGSTGSTTLTTQQIPSHTHTISLSVDCSVGSNITRAAAPGMNTSTPTGNTGGGQSHDHTLSANFVGSSTSTLSPYLVLIYIIKT